MKGESRALDAASSIDLANGARGEIVDIVLHLEEPERDEGTREVTLHYPPAYILVKFASTKAGTLRGLEAGVLPIVRRVAAQPLTIYGVKVTIHREQLPITAAYAFTDHQAQGQTLRPVLVDMAKPPSGAITPFNAYVACSKSGWAGLDTLHMRRGLETVHDLSQRASAK